MVKFFQRQINVFLVIFLITAIVLTIGQAIFYQNMFRNMAGRYDRLAESYALTSNELEFYKNEYTRSLSNLNTTEQDIAKIGELFESSEQQIAALQSELQTTSLELDNTQQDLDEALSDLRLKTTEVATKDLRINTLNIRYEQLQKDYDFLRSKATELKLACGVKCDSIDINT